MSGTPKGATPWIRVAEARQHVGSTVEIRGWLEHHRTGGKVQFLELRDGSGTMQCVAARSDLPPGTWEALSGLTLESAVILRGSLRADARARGRRRDGHPGGRGRVPRPWRSRTRSRPRSTAPTS